MSQYVGPADSIACSTSEDSEDSKETTAQRMMVKGNREVCSGKRGEREPKKE